MFSVFVSGARPKTLPAAVVPVAVASALAYQIDKFDLLIASLCLAVSLALQVGTNYVNDYADGQRGTAGDNRVGPLRMVGSGSATIRQVKLAAVLAFGVAALCGMALVFIVGPELLPVGIVSIAAGWAYTGGPKPYAYFGLGELFVFVFFGLVATMGTYYAQVEDLSLDSLLLGSIVGLLAVALLLTNNLRDITGDTDSGKQTLAVRIGDSRTRQLYGVVIGFAALGVCLVSLTHFWTWLGLLGFMPLVPSLRAVLVDKVEGMSLIRVLAATSRTQLLVGLGLCIGLVLS